MSDLEKTLDELIGEDPKKTRDSRRVPRHPRRDRDRSRERRRPQREFRDRYEAPRPTKLQRLSHGKPYLKITNLHYEISEADLKALFQTVGEILFTMIEYTHSGRSTGIAYVGFEDQENNQIAVEKFNGKKAVGEIIQVEEIKPLNVLAQPSRGPRGPRSGSSYVPNGQRGAARGGLKGGREPRPKKPTLEELDDELNRYMNNEPESQEVSEPQPTVTQSSRPRLNPTVEDLDKSLDDYMSSRPFAAT